jgi:hypothetical protein
MNSAKRQMVKVDNEFRDEETSRREAQSKAAKGSPADTERNVRTRLALVKLLWSSPKSLGYKA